MKNIAVVLYDFSTEYCSTVVDGISSFFKDKEDVRYIITTAYLPNSKEGTEFQYWTSLELLKSDFIDGIIILTNSFSEDLKIDEISQRLQDFSKKPVVSVGVALNLENNYFTHTVCDKAYEQVVSHLKNVHMRKRIAFFSGEKDNSPEAVERFEAYKKALAANGLEYDPKLVFPGDFTPGTSREVLNSLYHSKEEIDFDAVLCVNDFSAGGCLLAFGDLDVKVPEDVSIIGFDDSDFSQITFPTLSSINQTIPYSGKKSAEIMYSILNGEKVEKESFIYVNPVYRQSCGCISCDTDSSAFIDYNGKYHERDFDKQQQQKEKMFNNADVLTNINRLLNLMNSKISMNKIQDTVMYAMAAARIKEFFVCMYDTPQTIISADDFILPDSVRLAYKADLEKGEYQSFDESLYFNPRESIIPKELDSCKSGKYFLQPIFMHNDNYGYIYGRVDNENNLETFINLKIVTNVIINIHEYKKQSMTRTDLLNRAQSLKMQSNTDELTQIFNRRGFLKYAQQLLEFSTFQGKRGVVFFCDLDGLKTINDTWGHEIGDLAIKTEAQVLKTVFRDSDLVGRLSGDEFGVVAPGFPMTKIETLRERLISINKELSEKNNLPFTLSISIGPIEFDAEHCNLQKLLTDADKQLYEEKKIKHAKRGL